MFGHKNTRTLKCLLAAVLAMVLLPFYAFAAVDQSVATPTDQAQAPIKTPKVYSDYAPDGRQPQRSPVTATLSTDDPQDSPRHGFSYPWLTDMELERARQFQAALKAGEIAYGGSSVINPPSVTDDDVAVFTLDPKDFCGESFFVFLPDSRILSDVQLVALLSAFEELGINFDPDSLNDRNCCRHCNILETRDLKPEEQERMDAIVSRIRSGELKREDITSDVKVFSVEKNTHRGWGLDNRLFQFYPYRSMTDDELALFALDIEMSWDISPEALKEDALKTVAGLIRIPEVKDADEPTSREFRKVEFKDSGNGPYNELYKKGADGMYKYDTSFFMGSIRTDDSMPWYMTIHQLQEAGSKPEVGCVELNYTRSEDSSENVSAAGDKNAQIAAARKWAKQNLLFDSRYLNNWTIGATDTSDDGNNNKIQLVMLTPDWEINLWMNENTLEIDQCRIYSRKWYMEETTKWYWS